MATVILVHGAWLDATCWRDVAARLQSAGATVIVPDLPGHGRDATPLPARTLETYAHRVLDDVDAASEPVTLVGHSMGGVVISWVAELRPEKIRRLVYVAAYLLGDGEDIQHQQDQASQVPPAMRPAADWSTVAIATELMPSLFFHDVPMSVREVLMATSRPEATAPFGTPLHVTAERWGSVPRAYIRTAQDRAVTPALQDHFLAARPCDPVLTMDTGHAPFAADATTLASYLGTLAGLTPPSISS